EETQYKNLAKLTKAKRRGKSEEEIQKEVEMGKKAQSQIIQLFKNMLDKVWMDRDVFVSMINELFEENKIELRAPLRNAIVKVFGEHNEEAKVCKNTKGDIE